MVEWTAETRAVKDRSSLSLASDACWPAAAPGGRSPERKRERETRLREREGACEGSGPLCPTQVSPFPFVIFLFPPFFCVVLG